MVPEARLAEILRAHRRLRDAGEALIAEANRAGGRDNITVILLRLEEVELRATRPGQRRASGRHGRACRPSGRGVRRRCGATRAAVEPRGRWPDETAPAIVGAARPRRSRAHAARRRRRRARRPRSAGAAPPRSRRRRRVLLALIMLAVLGLLAAGGYVPSQSVYFVGTNTRGLVTMFQGFPYKLPGGIKLYSSYYVSGVSASTLGSHAARHAARPQAALRKRTRAR